MAVELLPPHEATPDNPRWHELRRAGVTASEIPVILGLSQWDSPWSLWHRKRGLIADEPAGEGAEWGRRLEAAIADAAADRLDPHGNLRFLPAGLYIHSERTWQMATPDRRVKLCQCAAAADVVCTCMPHEGDLLALLEVKHPWSWDGWGDDGTDDVPPAYLAQALWQLDVMELEECWLAAYTRHELRTYVIRRDAEGADADLAMMRKTALEFLESADPPPLDSHPATLAAVKQLHPDLEDREQDVPALIGAEYLAACIGVRVAEQRKRAAEIALRDQMGQARYAVGGNGTPIATRSIYERRRLDAAALRRDHPEIAAIYTTTSTVDRLTPARKDDQ
jgi:putative phage-type endonuclease